MADSGTLRVHALELRQHEELPLYMFGLQAGDLLNLASVSRLARGQGGNLLGYQRTEVRRHVRDIARYLETDQVLFPNAIILCLESADFRADARHAISNVRTGTLDIGVTGEESAWIVDGQQRTLALLKSGRRDLPVPVTAFVTDQAEVQRDQFLRVNNSKPLPRDLITELLPTVPQPITPRLEALRLPSLLSDLLNNDPESPFCGLIRRASSRRSRKAPIADNSVVGMLKRSLHSPTGCLFAYQRIATGEVDREGARRVLLCYWKAVAQLFPEAWALPPSRSRLTHGVGIKSMGRLMDRIMNHLGPRATVAAVAHRLAPIARHCRWTSGRWEQLDDLPWNALQNVQTHVNKLSEFLIDIYLRESSRAA